MSPVARRTLPASAASVHPQRFHPVHRSARAVCPTRPTLLTIMAASAFVAPPARVRDGAHVAGFEVRRRPRGRALARRALSPCPYPAPVLLQHRLRPIAGIAHADPSSRTSASSSRAPLPCAPHRHRRTRPCTPTASPAAMPFGPSRRSSSSAGTGPSRSPGTGPFKPLHPPARAHERAYALDQSALIVVHDEHRVRRPRRRCQIVRRRKPRVVLGRRDQCLLQLRRSPRARGAGPRTACATMARAQDPARAR